MAELITGHSLGALIMGVYYVIVPSTQVAELVRMMKRGNEKRQ